MNKTTVLEMDLEERIHSVLFLSDCPVYFACKILKGVVHITDGERHALLPLRIADKVLDDLIERFNPDDPASYPEVEEITAAVWQSFLAAESDAFGRLE